MSILLFALFLIFLGYLAVVLAFVTFQSKIIFAPPVLGSFTPKDHNVPYQDIELISEDGTKLHAWWIEQETNSKQALNLLYCHGNAADLSSLAHVSKVFYQYGFNILFFDYRGYGHSSKPPVSESITEIGVAMDTRAAYDWLKARAIDDKQIVVWGHSLGSSVAARLLTTRTPRAAVLEDAFPRIHMLAKIHYPWLLVAPEWIRDKFESVKYLAERNNTPLLLIHAEKDLVVPLALGQQLFNTISGPKEWLIIPKIGHSDFPSVASEYKDQILAFVNKGW